MALVVIFINGEDRIFIELVPVDQVIRPCEEYTLPTFVAVLSMFAVIAQKSAGRARVFPDGASPEEMHHIIGCVDRPSMILPMEAVMGCGDSKPFPLTALGD
jgi:hypothetical protein